MREAEPSDGELLAEWVRHQRECAFRQLVARYAGLVRMAAWRSCRDESMAAEASQMAFILLARKAGSLLSRTSLAGWLHLTAVMQAKNLVRGKRREANKRELLMTDMKAELHSTDDAAWKEMQPVLDEALAALPEKDREALFLRYYRLMEMGQVAETLGIGTDAAKKRIQRAMEKLRCGLMKRGCQTGGASFSIAIAAGFARDAQAAGLPISLISMKAATAAATPTSFFTTSTIMKASSFIPPTAALIAACFWIVPKRDAVAALERRYESVVDVTPVASGSRDANHGSTRARPPAIMAVHGGKGIDWETLAAEVENDAKSGRVVNFQGDRRLLLEQRLKSMSGEELLAELEGLSSQGLSSDVRRQFEHTIAFTLAERDPLFALRNLGNYLGSGTKLGYALGRALELYGKTHPVEAAAWVDEQIAAGRLEVKRLDGRNADRDRFEGILIRNALASDPAWASKRLSGLVPAARTAALLEFSRALAGDAQIAFAGVVRDLVPEKDRLKVISAAAWVPFANYGKVDAYLDRIEATPEERAASYEVAARATISTTSINRKLTAQELDKTWKWLGERMPDSRSQVFGEAIGNAVDGTRTEFGAAAELVRHYRDASGDDAVLIAFLKSKAGAAKGVEAREMALLIGNEVVRTEVLEHLK